MNRNRRGHGNVATFLIGFCICLSTAAAIVVAINGRY